MQKDGDRAFHVPLAIFPIHDLDNHPLAQGTALLSLRQGEELIAVFSSPTRSRFLYTPISRSFTVASFFFKPKGNNEPLVQAQEWMQTIQGVGLEKLVEAMRKEQSTHFLANRFGA
ncbi:hypothetical protein [Anoxybacillus thermarum]|uniref:hypothetical protein n=1 Tax=Anoxybacillus thermarum TaxID=404937 RepID=UPI001427BC7F|nr:hypothetical protein [Anoxybacillus thermarum]